MKRNLVAVISVLALLACTESTESPLGPGTPSFSHDATGQQRHGIEFDENAAGDLAAVVQTATSSNNTGAGVRADQALPGTGSLQLIAVTTIGNGGGAVVTNAGVTVTQ